MAVLLLNGFPVWGLVRAAGRAVDRARGRAREGEFRHAGDLAEEGDDGEADEAAVVGDHGLHGHEGALGEDHDDGLLGGGEVAHHRHHADDERRLRGIGDERLLAVEEGDLGGLQDVAAFVTLGGADEEVRLDVAEDGEPQLGAGGDVETAELRRRQGIAALLEGDVQVGREGLRIAAGAADLLCPPPTWGCRCRRYCAVMRVRGCWRMTVAEAGGGGVLDVRLEVEVEVHADLLEELVAQRDEADFDGHLQVLHAPQLLQQVDDFLVNFLRLADDQAEVGFELGDRSRSADFVPGGGLDGGVDQVDEAVEIGPRASARSAGAAEPAPEFCGLPDWVPVLPGSCASTAGLIMPVPDCLLSRLEATTASGVVIMPAGLPPLTLAMASR